MIDPKPRSLLGSLLWRSAALLALAVGALGILLPGLPTVPLWILATFCAARGWPALEQWLLAHPRYGGYIRDWRDRGAVPRRAKWAATLMMVASAALMVSLPIALWAKLTAPLVMLVVALWLWRHPDH